MSDQYSIRIDLPSESPRVERVACVRERLIRTTKYGPMEFERNGDVDGLPRYSPSKPKPAPTCILTDYPGERYDIPRPPSDEERFAAVGYGIGSSAGMCAREYTLEDEEHEARVAKAKKARAAVKDPFGKKRKGQDGPCAAEDSVGSA